MFVVGTVFDDEVTDEISKYMYGCGATCVLIEVITVDMGSNASVFIHLWFFFVQDLT